MRVAYIGHAWHQRTGSTRFLLDLLEREATVEQFAGPPGNRATNGWGTRFHEDNYDVIVIFQLHEAFRLLSGRHPNVVFAPMYDAMLWGGAFFWRRAFNAAKIACFSWAARAEAMRRGAICGGFQYYPDPARQTPVEDFTTLRGFLWYRRREIAPDTVFALCGDTPFESFTVQDAPDPDNAATGPWTVPPTIGRLERTEWSADGHLYAAAMRDSNVYFAPRLFEGIGMSLLEAMASGHCVVAPNAPTMNEYVANGTNGLLYAPGRDTALDFTCARAMGERARETIARGHQRWLTGIPALLDFIMTPTARLSGAARSLVPVRNGYAPSPAATGTLVSVVTICRNAAHVLDATMRGVLEQAGCAFEYIVLDRDSADGSVDIIRGHAGKLAAWRTARDNGHADAMNAALDFASGEWLLFNSAGDRFASEDALRRMFARVPTDAEIVYGHHIRRHTDGSEELRQAASIDTTRSRLRRGDLSPDWFNAIPGASAIAVRGDLLRRLRFHERGGGAAALELLFRACERGARWFHCDEVVSVETGPDFPHWADLLRPHGDAAAVDRFFAQPADARAAMTPVARLGGIALRMVTTIDRFSPAAADIVERIARGTIARRMVRWLTRRAKPPE